MTDDNFWGDKAEYIQKLASEVAGLKGVVQDVSQQIRRIERRIDLVLPEKPREKGRKTPVNGGRRPAKAPTMSEIEARQTIKRLTDKLHERGTMESVQAELRSMTVKHGLTPIARELGMTNTALPPKTELVLNIITRLRQSVMLTENIRKMPRVAEEEEHFGN